MERRFEARRLGGVVSVVLASALGCSSVPDLVFVDASVEGGGTDGGGTDGGGTDGAAPTYSCPDRPPPADQGVCCGTKLCGKCSASDCQKCGEERCSGTFEDACCRKNVAQMECRSWSACL